LRCLFSLHCNIPICSRVARIFARREAGAKLLDCAVLCRFASNGPGARRLTPTGQPCVIRKRRGLPQSKSFAKFGCGAAALIHRVSALKLLPGRICTTGTKSEALCGSLHSLRLIIFALIYTHASAATLRQPSAPAPARYAALEAFSHWVAISERPGREACRRATGRREHPKRLPRLRRSRRRRPRPRRLPGVQGPCRFGSTSAKRTALSRAANPSGLHEDEDGPGYCLERMPASRAASVSEPTAYT